MIQRTEARVQGAAPKPRKTKGGLQPLRKEEQLGMIHKVVWRYPESIMMLEGSTVEVEADISDFLDLADTDGPSTFSPTACTGIVPVPQEADVVGRVCSQRSCAAAACCPRLPHVAHIMHGAEHSSSSAVTHEGWLQCSQ